MQKQIPVYLDEKSIKVLDTLRTTLPGGFNLSQFVRGKLIAEGIKTAAQADVVDTDGDVPFGDEIGGG